MAKDNSALFEKQCRDEFIKDEEWLDYKDTCAANCEASQVINLRILHCPVIFTKICNEFCANALKYPKRCDEASKKDEKWLNQDFGKCYADCFNSQVMDIESTIHCPFDEMCDAFCRNSKSKEVSENDERECDKITHPNIFTKISKFPFNIIKAIRAKKLADKAVERAKDLFFQKQDDGKKCSSLHNGRGDAFRHCYWTCLMTNSIGEKRALDYSDYREFSNPGPCNEAIMDYKNNRTGVQVSKEKIDCEQGCINNPNLIILSEEPECF